MNEPGGPSGPHPPRAPGGPPAHPGRAPRSRRPPYPDEALDWLLPRDAPRVLDLVAGTGRLTRRLRSRGLDVVAVDPSAAMLAELRRTLPGVPTHQGDTARIPLPDHCADVVLIAEAWHGLDPPRALPEIARVLSPGGRLGLIRNTRDERVDWVARLGAIIAGAGPPGGPRLGPPFGPADRAVFAWSHQLKPDDLITLAGSRSREILLPADERAAVLAQIRQLMATHPALLGQAFHTLPYVTECVHATLLTHPP
ncbi:class I SAM-dependent methyltransferase [Actinoplanes sp. NEAU-A12]|uniref:Class I SAM-dependent methyltransferase n=1 Tax=Actinoplanes sandaracinus TaxID=3045177 RepID=A0ABT6WR30_9ACTN|nr:class I SAM-dependent methyltransferase [Actinoplanes sandaracinus]MDI6102197.1 class I SAM-dependent methyltransferase [Actinoplanes sandaracinus]